MALINCPECGHEVSDTIQQCPHCGYAINGQPQQAAPKKTKAPIIAIIAVVLILSVLAWKALSEKKAKQTYIPPAPGEKTVLPEIDDAKLPAQSEEHLHFCQFCGAANTDQAEICSSCGKPL